MVDGQPHTLSSVLGPGWRGISLEQPGPLEREYQIDGSDTTSNDDRDPSFIGGLLDSPLYRIDAWLRDESSYSRWERVRVVDLSTGQPVPGERVLPDDFRIEAVLRRPEATARLWLLASTPDRREGLELNRDTRNARWIIQRDGVSDYLPRWFFPEQPGPFAAELVHLLGRSTVAAYALALSAWLLARAVGPAVRAAAASSSPFHRRPAPAAASAALGGPVLADLLLVGWLVAAVLLTTREYHQLPHILDAVSYTFQAGLFAAGKLALDAPPLVAAFKGPFEVIWQGRLFSQYPPGAPAAYALGQLIGLEWLVGPLACMALIGATSWTAGTLYGRATGRVVLGLGALSPFVLFQAGSFLSHPIAGGFLAGALAAFVAGERAGRQRWYALSGALLGMSLLTREAASVLFALPLAARLIVTHRWRPSLWMIVYGLPFVLVYLLYNRALTGSPLLLPRTIFDPADHFGFGDGVGFHTRHTLAAGLANTDELLTLLQFELFGWPPLVAFGLVGVPFLFGRARTWDFLAACGFLGFVAAYAAYFYHGIALGSRYYFEAMPWLLLLAGRGAQVLAQLARSRLAVGVVLGALTLNTVLFYIPTQVQRRTDYSSIAANRRVRLDFVQTSLFGPRLVGVPDPALVLTDDWWLYNAALAALNCGRLPDCPVVFALALTPTDQDQLRLQFPDRTVLRAIDSDGHIRIAPAT
ncbi:MAG: hypothetical protein LC797_04135 [Chloroflexi bacterium]|nr:hypothetical protein [Chloroflexota bacterium]